MAFLFPRRFSVIWWLGHRCRSHLLWESVGVLGTRPSWTLYFIFENGAKERTVLVLLLLFVWLDCYNREPKTGPFEREIYCLRILGAWKFNMLAGSFSPEALFLVVDDHLFLHSHGLHLMLAFVLISSEDSSHIG